MVTAETSHVALARFGHALSDPTRVGVLLALTEGASYPAELADVMGVSRQSMSNHLTCLRECGLVTTEPEGRRTRYELADPLLAHALDDLRRVLLVVGPSTHRTDHAADQGAERA